MECKLLNNFEKFKTDPNIIKCKELKKDEDIFKCAYKVMGYKDNQTEVLFKLVPALGKCHTSVVPQMKECFSKCYDSQSCKEDCALMRDETIYNCFAKQYDIKDFDAKKAVKCSTKCYGDTIAEIIDCDVKCKEPIYKKFESSAKDSKNTVTSTKPSSGVTSLSTELFSAISVPILASLIL
jgi:hypothetical protein